VGPVPKKLGGTTTGGVATHVWELSQSLASEGHQVAIVADNVPVRNDSYCNSDEVDVYSPSITSVPISIYNILDLTGGIPEYLQLTQDFSKLNQVKMLLHSGYLNHICKEFSPDIIHTHHLHFRYPMTNLVAQDFPTITTSHSFHSTRHGNSKEKNKRIYKKNIKNCNNIVYVSGKVRKVANSIFEETPDFERVIFNGVNTRKFSEHSSNFTGNKNRDNSKKVLYVGNLVSRKGILDLLDCIKDSFKNDRNTEFLIVGDGPLREQVESFIQDNKIENVQVLGRVSEDRLVQKYRDSDLFVLPSYDESFGIVFIEAQATGLPVVGTTSVPEEIVSPPNCGIQITPGSTKELSEAIRVGLETDWSQSKIREHAEMFDWKNKAPQYVKTYQDVLSKSTGSPDYQADFQQSDGSD